MSVEAKTKLINAMKKRMADVLTVAETEKLIAELTEEVSWYEISAIENDSSKEDDMVKAYLDALNVEGRSEKTIARYAYVIGKLLQFSHLPSHEITVYDIRRFLGNEKSRGISESTQEGYRQVYSAYFNWLQREGLITVNPILNIGAIKRQKKIRAIYSDVEIEKMKMACKNLRDKAILCFLISTGCRISEVTGLDKSAVDLNNLECKVLGKGNKERVVYIDPVTGMALRQYFQTRSDTLPALFLGKGNLRIHPGGVRAMLKKLEQDSGVPNVHPHRFRRTLATTLIRRGMPIQEVAAILGHDNLDTTMKYVVLDKTDVQHSYRKYA